TADTTPTTVIANVKALLRMGESTDDIKGDLPNSCRLLPQIVRKAAVIRISTAGAETDGASRMSSARVDQPNVGGGRNQRGVVSSCTAEVWGRASTE
ncbi:hypothetical protein DJ71_16425, partial [Halorubrum sp. E3]